MNTKMNEEIVKKIYGEGSSQYENVMVKYWEFDRKKLIDSLEMSNNEKVLEIGVGTGKNLPYYPQNVSVVGIDFTIEMLNIAKGKLEKLKNRDITLLEMNSEKMSFPDNEFDAALESFMLCVTTYPERVFQEIVRVTKPGTKTAIFDYCRSQKPETEKWQELISTVARKIGFPPGVIVWDPLRDYEEILKNIGLPLDIIKIERHENPNPFLLTCSMLLKNVKLE